MQKTKMKIMTIIGARPQFIKAAAFENALKTHSDRSIQHILVHTGQHFDEKMSSVFFRELDIGEPTYNLGVSGGTHGEMTGRMLIQVEKLLLECPPDWVLVYGDTNSTLASALAAAKLQIPIAHVEAGLRSFNMAMPEEINRVLVDRVSTLLFCPTDSAVENLRKEGVVHGVSQVGDVMYDVALQFAARADLESNVLRRLDLIKGSYVLATCHRAENTDDLSRLTEILSALNTIATEAIVVMPIHPRTKSKISHFGLTKLIENVIVIEPLSYLDMVQLEKNAAAIITDSGGMQKEAFFYKVPCITTRDETEWIETVENNWNVLTGAVSETIINAYHGIGLRNPNECNPYGNGQAAEYILTKMLSET